MTEVAFHFNMPDKTDYLCRLLRKAVARGAQVAVTGPDAALRELDAALWSFSATEFVPHCRVNDAPDVRAASPVLLGVDPAHAPHHDVLLNLQADVPVGFEHFDRVIEVVGPQTHERTESRLRWKYYQQRGYALVRHDLASKGGH